MKLRLVCQRRVWCPTWLGWLCLLPLIGAIPAWWFYGGESFLSLTAPETAEVLVVEAWIGRAGMEAAKAEFDHGGYRWMVAAGGFTDKGGWTDEAWTYAEMAGNELERLGVPRDKLILASSGESESARTFRSAMATREALAAHGIQPVAVNVLTRGAHGRRSRLVFSKVLGPKVRVGVVSWQPPEDRVGLWWESSERAKELVGETAGYWFELLAGSGRWLHRGSSVVAAPRPQQPNVDAMTSNEVLHSQ